MKSNNFRIITLIALLALCIGCAHQQTPSGGPDDKTGPEPVGTFPKDEAVNVRTDASIEITFSEWILPASVKGVTLYPSTPIKVKVKGKKLIVKPQERLADSTTYHCVITSSLKDLRNNPVSRPLNIIFSTGPILDSGIVTGCVSDPARPQLQPNVSLFRLPGNHDDSGFCGSPDYLVQTDSNGVFSFTHIREGDYRLLAYLDKNSDYHLQHGSEELYLPVDSVCTISGTAAQSYFLYPATFDTSRQTIATLTTINDRTIAGTWKRSFDSLLFREPPRFTLQPFDDSSHTIGVKYRQMEHSPRFYLIPDTSLDSVAYRLIYSSQTLFDSVTVIDTLRVNGAASVDTVPPSLLRYSPNTPCGLKPELRLIWSEPVQLRDTLIFLDTLTQDTMIFTGDTLFDDTTRFSASVSLTAGETYRAVLFTSDGHDFRDNPLKARDSTDTAAIVTLSVLHADSFALSLTGTSPCLENSPLRKWRFAPLAGGEPTIVNDKNGSFRFDSIPSAKGTVSSFIDYNGNDIFNPGRLIPFIPPEPRVSFPDTVEARARWDVEGITLSPCDPCEQKRLLAEQRAAEAKADSLEQAK